MTSQPLPCAVPRRHTPRTTCLVVSVLWLSALLAGWSMAWYLGFVSPTGARPMLVRVYNASADPIGEVMVLRGRETIRVGTLVPQRGRTVQLAVIRGESGVCIAYTWRGRRFHAVIDSYVTHWTYGAAEALITPQHTVISTAITTEHRNGAPLHQREIRPAETSTALLECR